ncbi:hypothetical protein F6W70_13740 [Microbacterium maritypicum]|uniref:Uncharacterized protein n=1 Tax=Microbacterium maritypicum TaxID=33918 RepID=A0AAD3X2S3_MICMQ|nr:hypothetical protein [Microbacterium liquefaciens]KAB1883654.1 hypothetical protein F6W70_13740 [Microbacterium liquefaciens]
MTTNEKHDYYLAREQQASVEGFDVTAHLYASLKVLATNGAPDPITAIEQIADAIEKLEARLNAAS